MFTQIWPVLVVMVLAVVITDSVRFPEDKNRAQDEKQHEESMWPYPTYKPISWDKYYAHDIHDKHLSLTSGLAAGITIGVFFAVFLLTFGCRLYSQRHESVQCSPRSSMTSDSPVNRRLSVSDFLSCNNVPRDPPPPYEIAIRMPVQVQDGPPPFTERPANGERTVQSTIPTSVTNQSVT